MYSFLKVTAGGTVHAVVTTKIKHCTKLSTCAICINEMQLRFTDMVYSLFMGYM